MRKELDWLIACLRPVLDTLDRPATVVDAAGRFVYYNPASAHMDGVDADDAIGKHVLEQNPWLSREDSTLLQCLERGARFTDVCQSYIGPDGQTIPYLHTAVPLTGRDGGLLGAIEIGRQLRHMPNQRGKDTDVPRIATNDPGMRQQIAWLDTFAASELPILIYGETGTGKELFARRAHALSPRGSRPLFTVNCAAIPDTLLESTLFGTVRGAFTGAENRKGLLTQADGGTLFLDELNSMPIQLQGKLLRVLQDGSYQPLGSHQPLLANVRLIAALNQEPLAAVEQGRLREDLYYRLNVGYVHIPALRERRSDVPLLARELLTRHAPELSPGVTHLSPEAEACLLGQDWRGNVRELENILRRSLLLHNGGTRLERIALHAGVSPAAPRNGGLRGQLREREAEQIRAVLAECRGNVAAAARQLGMARSTLVSRLRRLGLA
ncbi:sigma 54-interacting transcriptional regulator [uncultured Aquitalea sp.]|uniref:sigma-54 interaction domain-containing protein n=1 Tax=uncultured Aquitalea sp. TaxID=540272 RepID=UPI0025F102B9|nr:sigma 54-interacting transcriptional regulator [uncultured Aquitalea sp.]